MLANARGFCVQHIHLNTRILWIVSISILLLYSLHPLRFASYYSYVLEVDIVKELEPSPLAIIFAREHSKALCSIIPSNLDDSLMYPSKSVHKLESATFATATGIEPGGIWQPKDCVSQHQVAIIIPYRNRTSQLDTFLSYIHPFLQKQMLNYRIFVIEQTFTRPFNRAKLFNIGFAEAMKIYPYHCFIFHDVDLIPQKLSNIYACTHQPRHMSSSLNTFRYNLPYRGLFGGAISIQQVQFELVNGFSNVFFGWGGEDDDFHDRIMNKGMQPCRFAPEVARYIMLTHAKELPSKNRFVNLNSGRERFDTDGVNTLKYTILKITNRPLCTWISVDSL